MFPGDLAHVIGYQIKLYLHDNLAEINLSRPVPNITAPVAVFLCDHFIPQGADRKLPPFLWELLNIDGIDAVYATRYQVVVKRAHQMFDWRSIYQKVLEVIRWHVDPTVPLYEFAALESHNDRMAFPQEACCCILLAQYSRPMILLDDEPEEDGYDDEVRFSF